MRSGRQCTFIMDIPEGLPPVRGDRGQLARRLPQRRHRRDSGGTGLGLAIVKHIVERHRGLLEIKSTVGVGTTVSVSLPIAS